MYREYHHTYRIFFFLMKEQHSGWGLMNAKYEQPNTEIEINCVESILMALVRLLQEQQRIKKKKKKKKEGPTECVVLLADFL